MMNKARSSFYGIIRELHITLLFIYISVVRKAINVENVVNVVNTVNAGNAVKAPRQ